MSGSGFLRLRASLTRYTLATESVLGVIERQRRDQERMLRALANG
jgi:hypothetical protein